MTSFARHPSDSSAAVVCFGGSVSTGPRRPAFQAQGSQARAVVLELEGGPMAGRAALESLTACACDVRYDAYLDCRTFPASVISSSSASMIEGG